MVRRNVIPPILNKSSQDYLLELQHNLQVARNYTDEISNRMQERYVKQYNRYSRDKTFEINDDVLVLIPDSTNKAFAQWQGPGKIVEKCGPYSYIIEIDGRRRQLHANFLRPFHMRIEAATYDIYYNSYIIDHNRQITADKGVIANVLNADLGLQHIFGCAVLSDDDKDFGLIRSVETMPNYISSLSVKPLPSQLVNQDSISHLLPEQRTQLLCVLDKYADCFSETPGFCSLAVHHMDMSPDFKPKRFKAYRVPEKLKPAVAAEIKKLLELGFIEPIDSPQASPIVVIMKGRNISDGIRMAVDYRHVNKYTTDCHQPLENIPDLIQKIGRANYISVFDAKSGYWQTPVDPTQKWINAFITPEGQFAWNRTPFGLKSAGYTYTKALRQALYPAKDFTASYIDDSATFSYSFESHMADLEIFLSLIQKAGFTFNIKKCQFAQKEVHFLGCIVGSGRYRPDPSKISTVHGLKIPQTKKEVRQILGFFSHFQTYIPNYAKIAKCITDLTKKRTPNKIIWTSEHDSAFTQLKQLLGEATSNPLFIADFTLPFNLSVDASQFAVAGILTQTATDGSEKPIAFTSQKLTQSQAQAWSTIEKEAYAVIHGLNKFRDWLIGSKINIFSDHNPLLFITQSAPSSPRLTRWALALQQFDITFHYRPGTLNLPADCASRLGPDSEKGEY